MKKKTRREVITIEEELDGTDITLEDLLRLVFIDKECENLKVVVDNGELTRYVDLKYA